MVEESISQTVARRLREGRLPHVAPPAAPVSSRVELRLAAPADAGPEVVVTDPRREHGWRIALAWHEAGYWHTWLKMPQEPTRLSYHFLLQDGTKVQERRQAEGVIEPFFGVWEEKDFQIAAYNPTGNPPSWVIGQVVYQIFPDRFAQGDPTSLSKGPTTSYELPILYKKWDELPEDPPKGRDFFGGDLPGVISKLDYIQKLGISCIYFTPVFDSPSNHRYDANDYFKIDPRLGTEADLVELIEQAKKRGIRVMLDGVFNHCSMDSVYFKEARADKLSPYYRWFNFKSWPDQWEGWADVRGMPEFVECPEAEEFFFGKDGVAHYWLGRGTAGWRTDVTPWITEEWWRRFRTAVRRDYPEAYLIAEDWSDSTTRLLGDTFDATMNYRFGYSVGGWAGGKLSSAELDDRLETLRRDTPPGQFMAQLNLLGSHDTVRLLTKLEGNKERVKLAATLQLAYPGVPMIYYGDEAGIEGRYAEDSRRPYPWGSADQDLLAFYEKAINARQTNLALRQGDVETVYVDKYCYGFKRQADSETVLALFNADTEPHQVTLSSGLEAAHWVDLLGIVEPLQANAGQLTLTLPGLTGVWLKGF